VSKLFSTLPRKILAIAVALIALYAVIGFVILPVIARPVGEQQLSKLVGRKVTIQRVSFNPFTMHVAARGLRVDEPEGGAIFSCASLDVTVEPWSSFVHHAFVFAETTLHEPDVNVVRNGGGSLSFRDLLLRKWPTNIRISIDRLRMVNGTVVFHDLALPSAFSTTLRLPTVSLENFSTISDKEGRFSVNGVSESAESVSWNGSFRIRPLRAHGEVSVEKLSLNKYYPYVQRSLAFAVATGTLSAHAGYELNLDPEHLTALLRDGTVTIDSLDVREQGSSTPLLEFSKLLLSGARLDMLGHTIGINSIAVTNGAAVLRKLPDGSLNVQHVFVPARVISPAHASTPDDWTVTVGEIRLADFKADVNDIFGRETITWKDLQLSGSTLQSQSLVISITGATLQDGKLDFTDGSSTPPVKMALTHLNVHIGKISSVSPQPAKLAVSGVIDDVAPLQISGTANPLNTQAVTNIRGLLQNVNLVPLSPYAERYFGYALAEGKLNLDFTLFIQDRRLLSGNAVEIDRLRLGEKNPDPQSTWFPIPLAIALLKDPDGKIILNIPIQGTLDNPKIKLGQIIANALFLPFTRAAAFPLTALGAQWAGNVAELGYQEFDTGSAELLPRETPKLDTIVLAMKERPQFMLDIQGSVDSQKDAGDLQLLAADRAKAVETYMVDKGTLGPDSLFLIDNTLENVPRKGSRVILSLREIPAAQ